MCSSLFLLRLIIFYLENSSSSLEEKKETLSCQIPATSHIGISNGYIC